MTRQIRYLVRQERRWSWSSACAEARGCTTENTACTPRPNPSHVWRCFAAQSWCHRVPTHTLEETVRPLDGSLSKTWEHLIWGPFDKTVVLVNKHWSDLTELNSITQTNQRTVNMIWAVKHENCRVGVAEDRPSKYSLTGGTSHSGLVSKLLTHLIFPCYLLIF